MHRLIDANALIEKAYWHGEHPTVDHLFAEGVDAVDVSDIDNAPTIEAEPVRHGRWVLLDECYNEGVYCSVCQKKVYKKCYANQKIKSKFCPHCGAKMDGGAGNGGSKT